LSEISEKIIKECLNDIGNPSNDNLTLMIVDLASYYEENKEDRPESPIKAAFKQGAKDLRLR